MRQSSAYSLAGRPSHIGSITSQTINPNSSSQILEKRKEFEALQALERLSAEHVRRMEALASDCEVMADAGKVLGEVLAQWPHMFRILNLYVSTVERNNAHEDHDTNVDIDQTGERLVRVPLDALQQTAEKDGKL